MAATALLIRLVVGFVDDFILHDFCRQHGGCTVSYLLMFAVVLVEYWCAYAVHGSGGWAGKSVLYLSGALGVIWLILFVTDPDRSLVNIYAIVVPQLVVAAGTLVFEILRPS